jgi:hypothetical protein
MSKFRLVLQSILVGLVLTGMISAVASAAEPTEAPFWKVGGSRLAQGKTHLVKLSGTKFVLNGEIGAAKVEFQCAKQSVEGAAFLGSNAGEHGKSEGTIKFEECKILEFVTSSFVERPGCKVNVNKTETVGSLWYHETSAGVKTEKIQAAFWPKNGTTKFTTITVKEITSECGALVGEYGVEGSVAAEVHPENAEVNTGSFTFPTEFQSHIWQPSCAGAKESTQLSLLFNKKSASLRGSTTVESTEMTGAFE